MALNLSNKKYYMASLYEAYFLFSPPPSLHSFKRFPCMHATMKTFCSLTPASSTARCVITNDKLERMTFFFRRLLAGSSVRSEEGKKKDWWRFFSRFPPCFRSVDIWSIICRGATRWIHRTALFPSHATLWNVESLERSRRGTKVDEKLQRKFLSVFDEKKKGENKSYGRGP